MITTEFFMDSKDYTIMKLAMREVEKQMIEDCYLNKHDQEVLIGFIDRVEQIVNRKFKEEK